MADEAFREFTKCKRIITASKNAYECIAVTDEGEHHFMTTKHFERWKYGRTYERDGVIYHSGEPQTEDAYAYDEDDWYDKTEREGE